MRQMLLDGALQEGVVGANDFKVVQRGAGANQSVDVGTGFAWVQIDTGTRNGMGHVTNDATANVTVTASNATNPRVDQIILRWNDSSIPTGSGNVPTLEVLTGTATAGAQITAPQTTATYRLGAAALPADAIRLADVLVPATSTSVTTANIVDRRPWARGANFWVTRQSTNPITTSATMGLIDSTLFQPRMECSGAEMQVVLNGSYQHNTLGAITDFDVGIDGVALVHRRTVGNTGFPASSTLPIGFTWTFTPAAGSHLIGPMWLTSAGQASLFASGNYMIELVIAEVVRPSASNT